MVLPRVKTCKNTDKWFEGHLIFPENNDGILASTLFSLFFPGFPATSGKNPNVLLKPTSFAHGGEYRLDVAENHICMAYSDYEGLRNAVATLSGYSLQGKIRCVFISDYPDNAFRSCLLDLARGYVGIEELKEHLLRLAKLKFNHVHLHLMDRQSYILQSDVVPNPDHHKQYSKQELREIVSFCNLLSLDAIPEIEFPTHAVNLLKALPELRCDIIDPEKAIHDVAAVGNPKKVNYIHNGISSWAVCVGKESTYKVYEDIIDELIPIFDSEYIHIGGDEIAFDHLGAFPHWDNCHACKALMERYSKDILSVYHHGIRRIHEIVKSRGKRTIKWNDERECEHAIDLPTDIILEYWRSDQAENAQAHINRFIEKGYQVINAQYQYTYIDQPHYMTAEKIQTWSPSKGESQESAILGGEMCAWELGNKEYAFYDYILPICMVLFSDRVWNKDEAEYDAEYIRAIIRTILGDNSLQANPLSIFDGIIPPRKADATEVLSCGGVPLQEISEIISALNLVEASGYYGKIALDKLTDHLIALRHVIQNI